MAGLLLLVAATLGTVIYFVPTFIAARRGHHNQGAIFALNIFLGWTFVGWVIALVWALAKRPDEQGPGGSEDLGTGVASQFSISAEQRSKGSGIPTLAIGVVALLGILFSVTVIAVVFRPGKSSTETAGREPLSPPASSPQLELLASNAYVSDGGGYMIIEGLVKNSTTKPIDGLMAVGQVYDDAGGFISSDKAVVDYNPLLPGQSSPFKVMIRHNPAIARYDVGFSHVFGRTVPHVDRRPSK